MAKQHEQILSLTAKVCRFGKFSNNTEYNGDDWEGAFTFSVSGLMLTKEELNDFRRDKHCYASWFDTKGDMLQPMPWWGDESFSVSGTFEAEDLLLVVSGDRELKFEAEEPEDKDDPDDLGRPACVLSRISLKPQVGGLTEMRFHLTLHPGLGKQNLILQEHQHREVKITLTDAHAMVKSKKQSQLPLGAPADGADAAAAN